ncbi:hypothetical protein [Streptomyces niveus]|uniref:hypothetical protein n=1 Tax=Streptomyces niveus TaxID=193462 RepID=UPI0034406186
MEIFRQAIRAAEEERDLLASLNKTTAAASAATENAAAGADDKNAAESCPCPGCSAVASLLVLLEQTGVRLEDETGTRRATPSRGVVVAVPLAVPLTNEKTTQMREAVAAKLGNMACGGFTFDGFDPLPSRIPATFNSRPISVEALMRRDLGINTFTSAWLGRPGRRV